LVRPTINSEKHIVQRSLSTIDGQTASTFIVVEADNDLPASRHVRVGAIVKAVYFELWYLGSASQPVVQTTTIEKLPSGLVDPTSVQMSDLNNYPNKKNIFYTTQGLVGDANTNPAPLLRQWIPIPKGKQRMGLGDKIIITIQALAEASNDLEICGVFIYKEYF